MHLGAIVRIIIYRQRRSAAEQEVLALIIPLAKLGCFQAVRDLLYMLQSAFRVGRKGPFKKYVSTMCTFFTF